MSGDVQPRKRKDKRKKKGSLDARRSEEYLEESALFRRQSSAASDEEEFVHHGVGSSDEVIHVYKESKLGGNIFAKIVFFGLLGAIGVMVGLIIFEYHGTSDVDTASASDSPWSVMLEGWVDNSPDDHEHGDEHGGGDHDHDDDHGHDHDEEHDDHDNEYSEGEHDHEEETEEETEDEAYVKQTYEELRAAYTQAPADEGESDADVTEESVVKSTEYGTTESEPEASEPEEEEDDELQEDEPVPQWKSESGPDLLAEEVEEVQTGSETEEESEEEVAAPTSGGPKSAEVEEEQEGRDFVDETIPEPIVNTNEHEQADAEKKDESVEYDKADITNQEDWEIKEDLDDADRDLDEGNPSSALSKFSALLSTHPLSARALHGKARALDSLAEVRRSNSLLEQAITAYSTALKAADVPDQLILRIANRTIDRMRFKGLHLKAVEVHNLLMDRFPSNITHRIDLAITYLMINRLDKARSVLELSLQLWPEDVVCRGYLGLTHKLQGNHEPAVPHLLAAVTSDHPLTVNSHFYFHLGDVLQRKGDNRKAMEIYKKGVERGIFRSEYQRSLYNVDRLRAQPWWTLDQTTYASFFRKLETNWKIIRDEGLKAYGERKGFLDEAESLRDVGDWKQFELYARGQKYATNCRKTPVTCGLVDEAPAARSCRRGQVKFSVMTGGTHVWPHCGPTNCRLRAHLGLVVPAGTGIRVAAETRSWEEGKVMVFDDSFEHEVWHNGTSARLVLIVDVWHPELTTTERATLNAI